MNQRMLARSQGGFTTCLVVRITGDGELLAANAGHLAPYRNGEELPMESCLPLGLAPDSAYAEVSFQLEVGGRLTLMTDGVGKPATRRANCSASSVRLYSDDGTKFGAVTSDYGSPHAAVGRRICLLSCLLDTGMAVHCPARPFHGD